MYPIMECSTQHATHEPSSPLAWRPRQPELYYHIMKGVLGFHLEKLFQFSKTVVIACFTNLIFLFWIKQCGLAMLFLNSFSLLIFSAAFFYAIFTKQPTFMI